MKNFQLLFFFATLHLLSYGQDSVSFKQTVWDPYNIPLSKAIKYIIDPSIKDSVNFYVKPDGKTSYQLMTVGQKKGSKDNFLSGLFAFSNIVSKDTCVILIFPKESPSGGFRINIIGDSSKSFHFIIGYDQEDTSGFVKLNQSDTSYKNELLVPPTTCKLILSKKPEFKEGEIFEGFIEFESQIYYYKNDSKDKKLPDGEMQWYISGYFRTFDPKKLLTN